MQHARYANEGEGSSKDARAAMGLAVRADLVAQLRMRARALEELERTPELSDRLRATLSPAMRVAPGYWF